MSVTGEKLMYANVVGRSGDKTIKVGIDQKVRDSRYGKYVKRRTRLLVHDEHNEATTGDIVSIAQSRPYSKKKSWRLVKVVEKKSKAEL